jgi:hypothetical protein
MRWKAAPGEVGPGLLLVAAGAFWIVHAIRLPLWEGFAPATGFLPLIYGALLVLLAAAALLFEAKGAEPEGEAHPVGRPLVVIATLAAGIAGIEPAGFAAAIFLMLLFLFKVVERLPLPGSLLAAGGTTAVLVLAFRVWLGIPLPKGPWGF